MDDIDPPREQVGAATQILSTLEKYGFIFSASVQWQSQHHTRYENALQKLQYLDLIYGCRCSRKQIARANARDSQGYRTAVEHSLLYPGTCRSLKLPVADLALRFRIGDRRICFNDRVFGEFCQNTSSDIGDFILKRRDGLYSYQLASVVDDQHDGITEIVRGVDLLDNTPRQIALLAALGFVQPQYLHLPIASDSNGQKLSKQNGAPALTSDKILPTLLQAWHFLGQPGNRVHPTLSEFWQYACSAWNPALIPAEKTIAAP